jgi:hypothetical protein
LCFKLRQQLGEGRPVVVEVLWLNARGDQVLGGFTDKELLDEEIKRGRAEAQAKPRLFEGSWLFLASEPGSHAPGSECPAQVVNLLDQRPISVDDAGHTIPRWSMF